MLVSLKEVCDGLRQRPQGVIILVKCKERQEESVEGSEGGGRDGRGGILVASSEQMVCVL